MEAAFHGVWIPASTLAPCIVLGFGSKRRSTSFVLEVVLQHVLCLSCWVDGPLFLTVIPRLKARNLLIPW